MVIHVEKEKRIAYTVETESDNCCEKTATFLIRITYKSNATAKKVRKICIKNQNAVYLQPNSKRIINTIIHP